MFGYLYSGGQFYLKDLRQVIKQNILVYQNIKKKVILICFYFKTDKIMT